MLSPELQTEWWAMEEKGQDAFIFGLAKTVQRQRIEIERDGTIGKFLPISVLVKKGFVKKDIEEKCTEVEDHPVLGKTYRVGIHEISQWTDITKVHSEIIDLVVNGRHAKRPSEGNANESKKKKKARRSSSSSSSKSSDSSSSSDSEATKAKNKAAEAKKSAEEVKLKAKEDNALAENKRWSPLRYSAWVRK